MGLLLGDLQKLPPVNDVVTVPGKGIIWWQAALIETFIGFLMISMVLFFSDIKKLEKKIPYFAAILVGVFVYFAGPISGFGMNPARTLASAIPSGIYTDFWLYMICPTFGMLAAAELYVRVKNKKPKVDFKLDGL
jgi:aquaporin Z